jgi:cytochrome c oxidase assembly protein subunit 15
MRSFRKLTLYTIIAVYLLILVGGIVRSTGSGMGCPDWPRCFGQWVPPSSVDELPKNYKEIYASYRDKKNQRFAKYLSLLGMKETAANILNDPSVLAEADFNPTKTWIEYLNRVVGVIIGFFIFAVFMSSLKFRKFDLRITVVACCTFLLVGFQGWLGSFVVSTNLTPWTITVHMFLALVIVALLLYLYDAAGDETGIDSPGGFWWLIGAMSALMIQILVGTQVREEIDAVSSMAARETWIDNLGISYLFHRSFSWIVLLLHVGLISKLRKTEGAKVFPLILILLILGTILTGLGMAFFAIPAFLQPVHLLLATITFGLQFLFLLKLNRREKTVSFQ